MPTKLKKPKRNRDAQINRVDLAELSVIRSNAVNRFAGVWQAQDWADKILRSRFMKSKFPELSTVNVNLQRRRHYPHYTTIGGTVGYIYLPRYLGRYLNDITLLHLMAHLIAEPRWGTAMHGRDWANIYVALVKRFSSEETYTKLIEAFRAHKVKFRNFRAATRSKQGRSGNPAALARYRAKKQEEAAMAGLVQLLTEGTVK